MKRTIILFLFVLLYRLPGTASPLPSSIDTGSSQTDTLAYHDYFEDPDQPVFVLYGLSEYWVTVRFTPSHTFTIEAIYFVVENLAGSSDPCYIYLALDSGGQPDPENILWGPYMIEGPLPHKEIITVELDNPVVVDSLQDFHVMVSSSGPMEYSVALELPADYPDRTGHSIRSHVGPFSEYEFPTPADAIIAVGGYYGTEPVKDVDLETTCLSNGLDLFFPDAIITSGLTLSSEVTNNGADSAFDYSLSWMIRDRNDFTYLLYDTMPPPIPPGGSIDVTCPVPWITDISDEYIITDSVFSGIDHDSTNNTSSLEQVVNIHRWYPLFYDDGESDETLLIAEGTSYAVQFSPWSRVASIDSVSLFFTAESFCRISVVDAFLPGDPPGEFLYSSGDTVFQQGWSIFHFPETVTPTRSTFFIAITGSGGDASLGIDMDAPLTDLTCLPNLFFRSVDSMTNWQSINSGDPLVQPYITKRGHPSDRYVELLSCDVDRDSVLPGDRIEVRVFWEYFDITGGLPPDLILISGLADYPSLVPTTRDTTYLPMVLPGLNVHSTGLFVEPLRPSGKLGISVAYIGPEQPDTTLGYDLLFGEKFYVLHPHQVFLDTR